MSIRVILDTDIGTDVDDCVALALILNSPELQLEGRVKAVLSLSGCFDGMSDQETDTLVRRVVRKLELAEAPEVSLPETQNENNKTRKE